jgi:hypothetical protein
MREELATVLRLVAEGKLSAEEAAPIIEALGERPERSQRAEQVVAGDLHAGRDQAGARRGHRVRIQVSERGRRTVDIHVPLAFAAVAARMVPGIPDRYAQMIEQAVDERTTGTLVDTEDADGDRVLITVE